MNILMLFTLLVGASGIIAQVMLLRELLVSFSGNELTIGIVLANWVLAEACGVFIAGKIIDRVRSRYSVFVLLQIVFSASLPFCVYLSRTFKAFLGVPFAEAIGLHLIYLASFLVLLPVAFTHAAMFSVLCKVYSSDKDNPSSMGRVYAWEMTGTIIGGLVFTYLAIPNFNSFQVALAVSTLNLAGCLFLTGRIEVKPLRHALSACLGVAVFIYLSSGVAILQKQSISVQWGQREVLAYKNSPYGNIAVTKDLEQNTYYYNGIPVISAPYPDITFVEEFGNIPLLFHPAPKKVLLLGAGAGGLLHEILKYPVSNVRYVEIDPLLIGMIKKYPTTLTEDELGDGRVEVSAKDARYFLKNDTLRYDSILIGLSNQADLSTNRMFTKEFFSLASRRLTDNGVFAFWLPGSSAYLSRELKNINACVLAALKENFSYVRIIPGDYNIFLASPSESIMRVSDLTIAKRILENNIRTNILSASQIQYRLSGGQLERFYAALKGADTSVNQDLRPIAVFETLLYWNKKFAPKIYSLLNFCRSLALWHIAIVLIFMTAIIVFYIRSRKMKRLPVCYAVSATGFFAMSTMLILSFIFQVCHGYLYQALGLLVSIFMAGGAFASWVISSGFFGSVDRKRILIISEMAILLFILLVWGFLTRFGPFTQPGFVNFGILFFAAGALAGMQFPVASSLYKKGNKGVGESSGAIYASDLVGAWFAGAVAGVLLVPVLGVGVTCIALGLLKLSSLIAVSISGK